MNIWFGLILFGLVSHLELGPGHRHVHSMGVGPPSQVLCTVAEKTWWVKIFTRLQVSFIHIYRTALLIEPCLLLLSA
jgi:hypothetical protein